ncbi:hypothetical protein DYBT9275_04898 [Dyadobacter sp. CECT 9275]|uniref:Transcriptional regulator, AbiEi antitoxin, Type IV TA system n=1 Tax=Dyadobacter helix TaxID=2822344 RepID=A0A916JF88_9BACT|nr:DUF6088 family protein [Dyadobacter sp. CECT 9275]CAG5011171.1 hypothetical protein DYBT9275_04898 [Dyadobacter sp. CECT 9275]
MKTSDYVAFSVNKLPKGYVFTYESLIDDVNKREAVIKALNRMVSAGKLAKLAKGKYYKPEQTPFGTLLPDVAQVVKDLLEEGGKPIGYLTGLSIYNRLGLTTQVSNIIQIGRNDIRSSFHRERYTISFIKQKNIITKDNIPLLQMLDTIRYIKKIPDTSIESALKRLIALLKGHSENELSRMVRLALKYPPSTRALLGALLDQLGMTTLSGGLYPTLNPITQYELIGADKVLDYTEKWNIK